MASFYQSNGRWVVDVYGYGRIRLGRNKRDSAAIHRHIELIEQAIKFGVDVGPETKDWIRNTSPKLRKRLDKLGLVPDSSGKTIEDLIEICERTNTGKRRTAENNRQAYDALRRFFQSDCALSDISKQDAIEFRKWLETKGKQQKDAEPIGLAPATASRRFKRCRSMFATAFEEQWISKNPFVSVVAGKQSNPSRAFFVTREIATKVLAELPDSESRLAFALARYGGFRFPSEAVELKWSGVNFERSSMTFRSKKTEHHEGKEFRTCPIFPELRPYLDEAWEIAKPRAVYVLPTISQRKNPRNSFAKMVVGAIKRAGVKPWPKVFANCRATRATEVANDFGPKAESEWIGHGFDTAMKHYLMVTDDQWKRATEPISPKSDPISEHVK